MNKRVELQSKDVVEFAENHLKTWYNDESKWCTDELTIRNLVKELKQTRVENERLRESIRKIYKWVNESDHPTVCDKIHTYIKEEALASEALKEDDG